MDVKSFDFFQVLASLSSAIDLWGLSALFILALRDNITFYFSLNDSKEKCLTHLCFLTITLQKATVVNCQDFSVKEIGNVSGQHKRTVRTGHGPE